MRSQKKNNKRAVNRHQTQSKASAAAQERSIERAERQAGQMAAKQWLLEEVEAAIFDAAQIDNGS